MSLKSVLSNVWLQAAAIYIVQGLLARLIGS